ncbi:MAG: ribosome silencing factor [Elainellaceae cyanobacterium]
MINRSNPNQTFNDASEPNTSAHGSQTGAANGQTHETLKLALDIVDAASERKAADISVLDVSDVSYLADYFVVMTGFSNVQVRAIARSIQQTTEENWDRSPHRVEGMTDGNWILLDYGDVIVHVFMPQEREYYGLEAFWGHARRVDRAAS